MSLDYFGVNGVAVVVAAAAFIAVQFVWYQPQVFGKRWSELSGRPLPQIGQVPTTTYVTSVAVALVTAYVLAVLADGLGATTLADAAVLGFLAWLGFVATTTYGSVLWEGRPNAYWMINAGGALVGFVVMGAIIGALA